MIAHWANRYRRAGEAVEVISHLVAIEREVTRERLVIVGFSKHGKGSGGGATGYFLDPTRPGREGSPPTVVRGNPELTRRLIDAVPFKHKYSSGILSFAPGEVITPAQESTIIDEFERFAFAGLSRERYNILWVRHSHAEHGELHFVTPRIEMATGRSLNICPPGEQVQKQFADFRSMVNARYGLADPEDPDRAREVSHPHSELRIVAAAKRAGKEPPPEIEERLETRQQLADILFERAVHGQIQNRQQLLEQVVDLGLEVAREGRDHVTVRDPENGKKFKLKGDLYAEGFSFARALERAARAGSRDYKRADPAAAARLADLVEEHIEKRTRFHRGRYPAPDGWADLAGFSEPDRLAGAHQPGGLGRTPPRELGADTLARGGNSEFEGTDPDSGIPDRGTGSSGRERPVESMWGTKSGVRPDRQGSGRVRGGTLGSEGVLGDDRTGNASAGGAEGYAERIRRAAGRIVAGARSLASSLRATVGGVRGLEDASGNLERASADLGQTIEALKQALEERTPEGSGSTPGSGRPQRPRGSGGGGPGGPGL